MYRKTLLLCCLASAIVHLASCQDDQNEVVSGRDHRVSIDDHEGNRCTNIVSRIEMLHVPESIKRVLDWDTYRRVFRKQYKSASEQTVRFVQFIAHVARVMKSLLEYKFGCLSYFLTVNKFSDRTRGEYRRLYAQRVDKESLIQNQKGLRYKRAPGSVFETLFSRSDRHQEKPRISTTVDWTSSADKCLQEPRDQGECGCCYAMAFMKLYEWFYCRQHKGQQMKFSEQYLVDCGHLSGLQGCVSGSSIQVTKFIQSYGLMPDNLYNPFTGKVEVCAIETSASGDTTTSIDQKLAMKPSKLDSKLLRGGSIEWEAALVEQPLVVFLRAEEEFLDYGGGIYESTHCEPEYGHFLVLVGHGIENGHPYWLLSNSFGTEWGIGGYLKLSKRHDQCIAYVLKATVEFDQTMT